MKHNSYFWAAGTAAIILMASSFALAQLQPFGVKAPGTDSEKTLRATDVPEPHDDCGRLVMKKGPVHVHRKKPGDQTWIAFAPRLNEVIGCADRVETGRGGRALIRHSNYSVALAPQSRVEMESYRLKKAERAKKSIINLTYGRLRTFVQEDMKKESEASGSQPKQDEEEGKEPRDFSRFRVVTPVVVAGVRGTDFYVSYSPQSRKAYQATLQGEVEVQDRRTQERVTVSEGQQLSAELAPTDPAAGKAATQTEPLKPEPLKVEKIEPRLVQLIRQASSIAREEPRFKSAPALETLGQPTQWKEPDVEVPADLEDIKNEF